MLTDSVERISRKETPAILRKDLRQREKDICSPVTRVTTEMVTGRALRFAGTTANKRCRDSRTP